MERYNILVERDIDGMYIASVQGMQGMYTQGKTFEEAMTNIKEVIQIWKEVDKHKDKPLELIGLQFLEI